MPPFLPATYKLATLPRGQLGILRSVHTIKAAIRQQAPLPIVRAFAARIVSGCGPYGTECRARRILAWVSRTMEYLPDPFQTEAIGLPDYQLAQVSETGQTWGDCDDAAALIGTLARSVGFPVRLAVASYRPDRRLHHVWTEVRSAGRWLQLDPFRAERFRSEPTRLLHVEV